MAEASQLYFTDFQHTGERRETVLSFENVNLKDNFSGQALSDISFYLRKGENLVILGPEGSGKFLISQLVTCHRKPDSGTVTYMGENIHEKSGAALEKYRSQIAFISFNFGLINNLSVFENVILPLRYHTNLKEKEINEMGNHWLERYDLIHKRDLRPVKLAHSEAMRVAFVRAMIIRPQLVYMDHALASQCPIALAKFLRMAAQDMQELGISFILSTFGHNDFHEFTQNYLLMYQGRIVFRGSANALVTTENPFVRQYLSHPISGPMISFQSRA